MKNNSLLLAAVASVGIFALFAFTEAPVRHEKIPASIWKEFTKKRKVAVTELGRPMPKIERDTNPPIEPRFDDFMNGAPGGSAIDLKDPKAVEQTVDYDPVTDQYIISEKIGDDYFRTPTYMTFSEYMDWRADQQQQQYFDRLGGAVSGDRSSSGAVDPLAKFEVKKSLVDKLFGGTEVDIKPQGNIDLTFGYNYQRLDNPTLPIRTQRQGNFDFGMNISMNATGKIGEKLNLAFNYNTQATFDFDNVMKLHYDPKAGFGDDDILQNIEAGNVSLPLRSQLIKGSQKLFGVKVETKWGRLRLTTVASQQQTKQQNLTVKGGGQVQQYVIPVDEYDENRHFFLSHYNRETFERSLKCLPTVQSLFRVTKLQVWATNDNNQVTTNRRDVVCLADLGEPKPFLTNWNGGITPKDLTGLGLPDNGSNLLYKEVTSDSAYRFSDKVVQRLNASGLTQVQDYEKLSARMLDPNRDFTYHEDLGFISINLNVQTDHIVGVAYEYTYNGIRHQVGEFVDEVANQNSLDSLDNANQNTMDLHQKVLFVKMLKPRTANVKLPIWDLMMKNIYAIGASQVEAQDFRFDIFYEDGKGEKRFIPHIDNVANPIENRPLIQVFRLDTLNQQRDPGPDGVFDFVPGLTINLRSGRVMIPVLEPFGSYLAKQLEPVTTVDSALIKKYCYFELYDSTVTAAREFLEKNRFTLRGSYKSQNSAEISLGSFNIPQGSVRVSGGGIQMVEGRDYEVDYNIGKVRILNDAVLQSGTPVNISFEDNTLFGFNQRTMLGARADYEFSKNMSLGATWMNLFERPLTQKINIGDDPINNKVYGLDFNVTKDAPWLTKAVDKIPGINTKAPSNITFQAEAAALDPGHSKAINTGIDKGGVVYLDDFEGSSSGFDLRTPYTAWTLASIPQNDGVGGSGGRWPESKLTDSLAINANRAKAVWYQADPSARTSQDTTNPYTRIIESQEIFPNRQLTPLDNSYLRPFDFTYYPKERGPYNFEIPDGYPGLSKGLAPTTGELKDPENRWAGVMRGVTTNDFEQANIEFIEFWMLNPFIEKPDDPGNVTNSGKLLIQLGTMSEDIIKDGTVFFENGLPTPKDPTVITRQTNMGRVPFYQPVVNFFDNDVESRKAQDVGLDGLPDSAEVKKFKPWLEQIQGKVPPAVFDSILKDPSNDNYRYFRSDDWKSTDNLLAKYGLFNNPEGNSPVNSGTNFVEASTTYPDIEDVNKDNTFNETESYFSYELPIENDGNGKLRFQDNPNFGPLITQVIERPSSDPTYNRTWYRIKIPLNNTTIRKTVGGINDFRAIQFIRLVAKDFDERVTFRFATFELGRNQWRRYTQPLFAVTTTSSDCGDPSQADLKATTFDVNNVNVEENTAKLPFNYVLPPGIRRENSVGAFPDALQNEQSLSLSTCNLLPCDSKAIYKLLNLDMRQFGRMKMFVHAETVDPIQSNIPYVWEEGNLRLFIRMGSDFTKNYYEYSMPLKPSLLGLDPNEVKNYAENVWLNKVDFPLELLVELKKARNEATTDFSHLFTMVNPDNPLDTVKIIGNPSLGLVKGVMIGVKNADIRKHCAELWLNEFRLTGINEKGGYAGLARADIKLADFASVQFSSLYESVYWGGIEQKTQQRSLDEHIQIDVAADVQLDKFLPEKSGVRVPFHTNYSENIRNPLYDPRDLDVKLKDKIRLADTQAEKREIKRAAQDVVTIKGYNFTNVRVESKKKKNLSMPWDIANFSLTYAYNETDKRNPFVSSDNLKQYKGGLDYNWTLGLKPIQPFKKAIKKDKYLKFISEFNFNPLPTSYGFNTTMERNNQSTTYRFAGDDETQNTFYNKRFTWDRNYDLSWDLSKGLKFNYDATAKSIIDELNPYTTTEAEQRSAIKENLRKGGRLKTFNQNMSASYALPFKQIPMMDWIQSKASLSAGYSWDAASLKVQSFGNVIQNNQTRQINGDFNFETLYNKSKYLSKINKPAKSGSKGKGSGAPGGKGEMSPPGGRDAAPGGRKGRDIGGASLEETDGELGGGKAGKGKKDPNNKSADPTDPAAKNPGGRPTGAPGGVNPDGSPTVPGGPIDPATAGKDPEKSGKASKKDPKDPKGKDEKKKDRQPSTFERIAIRPLMTVRKARLNYTEVRASVVPGFMPVAKFLGQDAGFEAPGWEYIIGNQPDNGWLNRQAYLGRMSQDIMISQQVSRNFSQNFDAAATLEPFPDFRVELTANRQFQKNNTELFKIPDYFGDTTFEHRASRDLGSMTISYYSMQTLWNNDIDGIFDNFENNRLTTSARLAAKTGNVDAHEEDLLFKYGYGKIQQEVLIPAFISAYTKSDPSKTQLDVFKTMPKLNWKLTYNGLSKLNLFKNVFASFNLTHGYKSTLTINSYATDLQYDPKDVALGRTTELTGDYIARYEIPQLVISEQFQPLLGIDMRFKNEMNLKLDMKKSRNLGMSFIDYQLAEQRTTDYTLTWGYKLKNVYLPFLYGKAGKSKMKKAKAEAKKKKKPGAADDPKAAGAASGKPSTGAKGNDLKFDFNFSFRDDVTANHRLDSGQKAQRTRGSRTYRISPTVDYSLNKRLTLGLFCDYNKTVPKTSASYPITNIQSGLRVRFTLQ